MPKQRLEMIFKQIASFVDEGERLLQDDRLRLQIKRALPATIENSYDVLSPREFMIRLTVDSLSRLLPSNHVPFPVKFKFRSLWYVAFRQIGPHFIFCWLRLFTKEIAEKTVHVFLGLTPLSVERQKE